MSNRNNGYQYNNQPVSISSILRDQRELELNPIRTQTEKANLQAAQAVAEFQSNLVKDQVNQWSKRDREELKQQYTTNAQLMAQLPVDDPMIAILEAENKAIIAQLSTN